MDEFIKSVVMDITDANLLLWGITSLFASMSILASSKKLYSKIDYIFSLITKLILILISYLITHATGSNSLEIIVLILMIYSTIRSIDDYICEISFTIARNFKIRKLNKLDKNKPM